MATARDLSSGDPREPQSHASRLLLLVALSLTAAALPAAEPPSIIIATTEFVLQASSVPPDTADWQLQKLPDQWRVTRPGVSGDGWYRATFTLAEAPRETWAVFLPRFALNAAVFVNGQSVGEGGRFDEPVARNWNRPLLMRVPAAMLNTGANTLHIRIRSFPAVQGSLAQVEVGPEAALQPKYEREFFLRITINQALTLIIAMIGLLTLSMWWRRRRDSMYGYFGASALVWAVNSSNLHLQYVPLPTRYWEILVNAAVEIFAPLVLISLLRFVGRAHRALEMLLWGIAVASPVTLLVTPEPWLVDAFSVWHLAALVGAVLTLFVLVPAVLSQRNAEGRLLIAALLVNMAFGAHDWLVHAKFLPPLLGPETRVHLLHFGAPVFFLIVGWIMTSRFVGALNQLERMNVHLEERIKAKTTELEANFQHVQELRSDQAVTEERERIYRDLHDDIGAKLLQMVYRAGDSNAADLARSALQDLRDVVSRPRGSALSMDDMLADWRAEADQRLSAAHVRLVWQQPEALRVDFLQPSAIHVGRILREAISNTIRHAAASMMTVTVADDGREFRLEVTDDGSGYDVSRAAHGSGLANMRQRAGRIGGAIEWRSSPGRGCTLVLTVPRATLATATAG